MVMSLGITFIIIGVNSGLKIFVTILIKFIGEDTHSAQIKSITNGVFAAQFFNTAIILLLVAANFKDAQLPGADTFNGPYNDFTPLWYSQIGFKVFQTMAINTIMPFVAFGTAFGMKFAFRFLDRGLSFDPYPYNTKKTSTQLYVDLYSGPEYLIHVKYSGILNVVFVCMMYGVGMPILFLVAAITFFILYSVEKVTVTYFYKQPPAFDDKLTKNAAAVLKWAGLIYLGFGYWMVSNMMMFDNEVEPRAMMTSFQPTSHSINDQDKVNQGSPLMFMTIVFLVIAFMQGFFKKTLK